MGEHDKFIQVPTVHGTVTLTDEAGKNPVDIIKWAQGAEDLAVHDVNVNNLLEEVISELKKMNKQLSIINEMEII